VSSRGRGISFAGIEGREGKSMERRGMLFDFEVSLELDADGVGSGRDGVEDVTMRMLRCASSTVLGRRTAAERAVVKDAL